MVSGFVKTSQGQQFLRPGEPGAKMHTSRPQTDGSGPHGLMWGHPWPSKVDFSQDSENSGPDQAPRGTSSC